MLSNHNIESSVSVMSRIKAALKNLLDSILKISEGSKTELAAILIAFEEERFYATCRTSKAGKAELIANHHDQVFRIASLGKVYIAAAACLMIDVLSADSAPTNPYHRLKGAWDKSFTTLFNEYSKGSKISSLHGDPKVINLLLHYKGVRNVNHLLFSPDGTILQSEEDFLKTIPQYTRDTNKQDTVDGVWSEYSNANYILIALFLEAFLKSTLNMSLGDFLKEKVFTLLGMHHTYLSFEDLRLLPDERRARPHVVSSAGERRQVIESDETRGQFDAIELATLGPYSSIYDQGLFFGAVNSASDGKPTGDIGVKFVDSFFRSKSAFVDGEMTGYKLCGLYTTSDTTYPGSNSLNRLMSPDGEASKHALGKMENSNAIKLYYLQGSATGWGCTVYFAKDKRVFVIVLTNTSGPVDVSDPISRLCLQEIFDLRPSRDGKDGYKCRPKGWENMNLSERHRAHYVELSDLMFEENAPKLRLFEQEDAANDTDIADWGGVCGTYVNAPSRQYLNVVNSEGKLRVGMRTESKSEWSKLMRFVRKGDAYRICSMYPLTEYTYRGLAIDCFGAWKNLEFQAERVGGVVTCLSRKGLELTDHFIRES
jgi:CubicO group peptidase (beta-lactamase class C family)